jgi:serine/threonine protein phosphatase PrpC
MDTEGSGASRAGGDGVHNEDAFLVEQGLGLYLVCDGASGSAAGEIAARLARDAVAASIERSEEAVEVRNDSLARIVVEKAMKAALGALAAEESADPGLAGLSTTITMLLAHGHLGVIGHRGDSRAYLLRRGRAQQLTIDGELTQAVGNGSTVPTHFDVFAIELRPRDTIVLCTDGAEQVVEDPAITRVARDLSPRLLASRIVSAARHRGPNVDATAVVVRVRGENEPGWLELSELPQGTAFGHTLERARVMSAS